MFRKEMVFVASLISVLALAASVRSEPKDDAPPEPGQAQATSPAADASDGQATPDDIKALISQLNDDKFSVRQDATRRLVEVGQDAIPHLVEAAQGPHLEVTMRSFDIFKKLLKSKPQSFAAVKGALEKLAASENEAASTRADKILKEITEDEPQIGQGPFGFRILPFRPGGGIQAGNAQIQIQVQAVGGPGGVKKISIKNVNGVKEINAEEGGRKVHIVDDPQGIKMEVTEKNKEGKEETKKYQAKDEKELKKKHPEAHKLYEKYATNNGGLQIQAGPAQLRGARIQIGPNGIQLQRNPGAKKDEAKKDAEKKDAGDAEDSEAGDAEDSEADDEAQEPGGDTAEPKTATEKVRKQMKQAQKESIERQIESLQEAIERLKDLQEKLEDAEPDSDK